jgi:hypothetical protein
MIYINLNLIFNVNKIILLFLECLNNYYNSLLYIKYLSFYLLNFFKKNIIEYNLS